MRTTALNEALEVVAHLDLAAGMSLRQAVSIIVNRGIGNEAEAEKMVDFLVIGGVLRQRTLGTGEVILLAGLEYEEHRRG